MVDTSEWPGTFCYLTIACIVVLNSKFYFVWHFFSNMILKINSIYNIRNNLTYLFSALILTVANGIYQNTVYGLAAKLPFNYIGAVILGSVWSLYLLLLKAYNYTNKKGLYVSLVNQVLFSLESERDHCGIDKYNVDRHGTKSTHCGYILFHHCFIHLISLFRYIFCLAT